MWTPENNILFADHHVWWADYVSFVFWLIYTEYSPLICIHTCTYLWWAGYVSFVFWLIYTEYSPCICIVLTCDELTMCRLSFDQSIQSTFPWWPFSIFLIFIVKLSIFGILSVAAPTVLERKIIYTIVVFFPIVFVLGFVKLQSLILNIFYHIPVDNIAKILPCDRALSPTKY
jgi:hypothetical protein